MTALFLFNGAWSTEPAAGLAALVALAAAAAFSWVLARSNVARAPADVAPRPGQGREPTQELVGTATA